MAEVSHNKLSDTDSKSWDRPVSLADALEGVLSHSSVSAFSVSVACLEEEVHDLGGG